MSKEIFIGFFIFFVLVVVGIGIYFYIVRKKTCTDTNCTSCDTTGLICNKTGCKTDYYNDDGICKTNIPCNDTNCKKCDLTTGKCSICNTDYKVNNLNGVCDKKCSDNNCFFCNSDTGLNCTACNSGYYLNGTTCNPCSTACSSCKGDAGLNCTACNSGYNFHTVKGIGICDNSINTGFKTNTYYTLSINDIEMSIKNYVNYGGANKAKITQALTDKYPIITSNKILPTLIFFQFENKDTSIDDIYDNMNLVMVTIINTNDKYYYYYLKLIPVTTDGDSFEFYVNFDDDNFKIPLLFTIQNNKIKINSISNIFISLINPSFYIGGELENYLIIKDSALEPPKIYIYPLKTLLSGNRRTDNNKSLTGIQTGLFTHTDYYMDNLIVRQYDPANKTTQSKQILFVEDSPLQHGKKACIKETNTIQFVFADYTGDRVSKIAISNTDRLMIITNVTSPPSFLNQHWTTDVSLFFGLNYRTELRGEDLLYEPRLFPVQFTINGIYDSKNISKMDFLPIYPLYNFFLGMPPKDDPSFTNPLGLKKTNTVFSRVISETGLW